MSSVTALIYRSRVSEFHAFPSTSVTAPGCRVSETLHSQVSEKQPLAFPWLFTAFHPPASVLHTLFIPDVLVSAPATLCLFSCLCSYDHCHDCGHCFAVFHDVLTDVTVATTINSLLPTRCQPLPPLCCSHSFTPPLLQLQCGCHGRCSTVSFRSCNLLQQQAIGIVV